MLTYERRYWDRGFESLAGVDEAGRGPLAGPVVASAVVFDRSFALREETYLLKGLTDSKKLSPGKREYFYAILKESEFVRTGTGQCSVEEIDSINILNATHMAMARALDALGEQPDYVLIDGLDVKGITLPYETIVRGDSKSMSIAAASVVAKVERDRIMDHLDTLYPEYGFASHKGYGTSFHMQALLEHGPSPVHRKTFRPVKESSMIRSVRSRGEIRHEPYRQADAKE